MESLSRPFHSRKPSNAYDGVFSGHRRTYAGAAAIAVEDYREIFSSSQASSIPVLDLSKQSADFDLSLKFRSMSPDYSNIFGGFRDEQVAVSYDQLFACDKPWSPSSTTASTSQDSDNLCRKSSDALKQFNMSYNKTTPKRKDELDGTKHVTQLHDTPGFTRFIDEPVPPPNMEAKKYKSSPVRVSKFVSEDKTFDTDFNVRRSSVDHKTNTYFDEEVDVNSDASASAAALKKAIEKAQESIRIAKESVGRKKKGLRSFSNKTNKDSIKVEDIMEDVTAATSSHVFDDVGTNTVNLQDFMDGEKLFVAKKVIDEINGKISESSKECCDKFEDDNTVVSNFTQVMCETESRPLDSVGKDEFEAEESRTDQTDNMFVDDYEGKTVEINTIFVKEVESVESEINDEVRLSNSDELVEELNELIVSQNVVVEQEDVENVETTERHEKVCDDEANDKGIESEDDHNDEIYKEEEGGEMVYDVCEPETNDNEHTCDNSIEESEVNLQDDSEIKQQDNDTSEIMEENLDDTFDDNVIEETEEVEDDVTEASDEFQIEEESSEKMTSEDNEDDFEVKYEENDIQSESSSCTTHDVKTEFNESNKEIDKPDITTTIETNQKPQKYDIGETGPSKVLGKQNSRRIDEMTAKNNRLAVDRAIREARERAFAEARERVERERAAVEKATEEVRQRMMADAREKVAKASVGDKSSSDGISARSKLKAERAAVERATSEARQRALEKAMSQKSVSDLNSAESALRSKEKLEKQNRIMERAAKALAEKEKRDLLAQKEQAERNRLSENLDADIKRWSNGKEGNLRALLSTLQYILGPESGWQVVSLTEIISSSAVKKAYRKATLCVHPDKLQQRGASIQQKYICEKVFDLLKAAWNRFNSEER